MSEPHFSPRPASRLPALVVGTMNFGRRTPEPEAKRIVDAALAHGLVLFDTANAYGDGESERILGRVLGPRRDDVLIATKVGWWRKEGLAAARVRASLDESLARLGTDRVDLYYLHVPDHETPIEATLAGVADVLASGKARRFAISNYASWQALEVLLACDRLGVPRPAVAQQLYNLLIRQLDLEYLRFARRYDLHTTVYNPLAGGLLARVPADVDAAATPGSRFHKNALYQRRYLSTAFVEATRAFDTLAREAGLDLVTLAYAWLAQRPGVDSILVGPGTAQHLEAAVRAVATPLSPEVVAGVDAIHLALVGTDASYAR
ncbi:MAG: aldo/keto reductase [Deltaproteobacteria bacterium]|nr:aldo/keto reductase [Deltaproteobacteria bacterium]